MTYRSSEVCDKLDDRGYFGEKYTVFDENGKRVSLQSFANLASENLRFKSNTTRPRKSYESFQSENPTLVLSARTQSARLAR
jgi:hypothetical protein